MLYEAEFISGGGKFESNYDRIKMWVKEDHIAKILYGLNRTMIGLKYSKYIVCNAISSCLNRTMIGLKYIRHQVFYPIKLLRLLPIF